MMVRSLTVHTHSSEFYAMAARRQLLSSARRVQAMTNRRGSTLGQGAFAPTPMPPPLPQLVAPRLKS